MFNKIVTSVVFGVALSGCATMFNSEPRAVSVIGTGQGTYTLTRNGIPMQRDIKLPQTIMVPNGWDDYALLNSKNEICPIGKTANGATFLNILLGGVIGLGIDAATGDMIRAKSQVSCNI